MMGDDVEIIYTPAVKDDNIYLEYFISKGRNKIYKRSEILGEITKNSKCIAVAGTHGKTTTTGIISHLLYSHGIKFKAFVGGIMKGYNSNYIYTGDDYVVVEADEYDRSFLNLSPDYAVITSIESDHLDIYGDFDSLIKSFELFSLKVKKTLVAEEQVKIKRFLPRSDNIDQLFETDKIGENTRFRHGTPSHPKKILRRMQILTRHANRSAHSHSNDRRSRNH